MARSAALPPRHGTAQLGAKLRGARQARGLTIEQVAEATSLTKGFISKLERNNTAASVASLVRVCDAVGIRVGSLFESDETTSLVRKDEAPPINFGGKGVTDVLLTPSTESQIQVIKSVLSPSATAGDDSYALPSSAEFVHILEGQLELTIGDSDHRLHRGDSLTFSPREPHTWRNPCDEEEAVVLWVLSPAS